MGFYENTGNGGKLLAGRGKAEYGASTVRKGSFEIQMNITDSTYDLDVTFSTPMPDNDYIVDLVCHNQHGSVCILNGTKTANGFTARASCVDSTAVGETMLVSYTAYKLYTNIEYNGLLTDVAELKARTKSNIVNCELNTNLFSQGSVTYAIKDGWCQVSVYGLKPKAAGSSKTITNTPMPKAKMAENMACVIKQDGTPAAGIWIDPTVGATQLNGHFPTDEKVWGTLIYQVADDVG